MDTIRYPISISAFSFSLGLLLYILWGPSDSAWFPHSSESNLSSPIQKSSSFKQDVPLLQPKPFSQAQISFQHWMEKGKEAEKKGNFIQATRFYAWALSYFPDKQLQLHLEELNVNIRAKTVLELNKESLWLQAKNLENVYQYEAALLIYKNIALSFPQHKSKTQIHSKRCQEKLLKQKKQKTLISQANMLAQKGEWKQSANAYKKALALGNNIDLKQITQKYQESIEHLKYESKLKETVSTLLKEHRFLQALLFLEKSNGNFSFLVELRKKLKQHLQKKMAYVSRGYFWRGNDVKPEEGPLEKIMVNDFYIDRYEVTNEEYLHFVKATGKDTPSHWSGYLPPKGKEQHPVSGVSWEDARSYAQWIGKRLPTEKEWEKAARGLDQRRYPWGNQFLSEKCNSLEAKRQGTSPVGAFPEGISPFGCHDMIGNVSEWTMDIFRPYHNSSSTLFRRGYRVARGGSWYYGKEHLRVSSRSPYVPETRLISLGFRCAIDGKALKNYLQ